MPNGDSDTVGAGRLPERHACVGDAHRMDSTLLVQNVVIEAARKTYDDKVELREVEDVVLLRGLEAKGARAVIKLSVEVGEAR